MTRASLAAFAAGSAFLIAAAGAAGNDGTIQRQDAKATSNARNMVSYVEACWTDSEDYRNCRTAKELGDTGLPIGRHRGQVRVVRASRTTFRIASWSRSGHHFYVTKTRSGALKRTCTGDTTQICVNGLW